jgi:hypothetical protein
MTTPTLTERGRLTALRAAALFDGTSGALARDPLVLIDGDTIVAVDSGYLPRKASMLPTRAGWPNPPRKASGPRTVVGLTAGRARLSP